MNGTHEETEKPRAERMGVREREGRKVGEEIVACRGEEVEIWRRCIRGLALGPEGL